MTPEEALVLSIKKWDYTNLTNTEIEMLVNSNVTTAVKSRYATPNLNRLGMALVNHSVCSKDPALEEFNFLAWHLAVATTTYKKWFGTTTERDPVEPDRLALKYSMVILSGTGTGIAKQNPKELLRRDPEVFNKQVYDLINNRMGKLEARKLISS